MIQAVIFDLDGTLLDRDSSLLSFITKQCDRFLPCFDHITKKDYIKRFIQLDCHGHVWKDKVYQSLINEFQITQLTWQDLPNDYETQFIHHCIPFPYLIETLTQLQKQNFLLGMITNGRKFIQSQSIKGLGIQIYFDTILISEVEQIRKPQPEIFNKALSQLKVSAQESVYIGDNPTVDIIGAKNAGLKTIWRKNKLWSAPQEADAVIHELNEILPIIKQWIN